MKYDKVECIKLETKVLLDKGNRCGIRMRKSQPNLRKRPTGQSVRRLLSLETLKQESHLGILQVAGVQKQEMDNDLAISSGKTRNVALSAVGAIVGKTDTWAWVCGVCRIAAEHSNS